MPDAQSPAGGFATRLIGRLVDPTLLSLPIVAVAFVVLRSHHLIAEIPLWLIGALLGGGFVAEGIETDDVAAALRLLGCEIGPGYWLSRPLDPATMGTWLRAHIREYGSTDATVTSFQVGATRPGHLGALPGATA